MKQAAFHLLAVAGGGHHPGQRCGEVRIVVGARHKLGRAGGGGQIDEWDEEVQAVRRVMVLLRPAWK